MTEKLPLFTESRHCGQGAMTERCRVCRSRRSFRRLISEYAVSPVCRVPDGNIDFDCPHGVPWSNKKPMRDPVEPAPRRKQHRWIPRPGDVITWLASRILRIKKDRGCGCADMATRMNRWGWRGCFQHRREILIHLLTQVRRRLGLPVDAGGRDLSGRSPWQG